MSPIERVRAKTAASEILGVSHHASREELRVAWHRAAKELHPDQDGGDGRRFAQARAAYELLSNSESADLDIAAFVRATYAPAARSTSIRRPQVAARVSPLAPEIIEECRTRLAAVATGAGAPDGAETAERRPEADHVPHSVARQGRQVTYRIATPLVAGVNRVALPTALIPQRGRGAPAILQFVSERSGTGEFAVPDDICRQRFPGARDVRIVFQPN